MISVNPNRFEKHSVALYEHAEPPVLGHLHVWSFPDPQAEVNAIADSCGALINAGMRGREDDIVILISDRQLQLGLITEALANQGLEFDAPSGEVLTDNVALRAVYCALRILHGQAAGRPDYLAHRAFLSVMAGVGVGTQMHVGDQCIQHNHNFHAIFYGVQLPGWLSPRASAAIGRVRAFLLGLVDWSLDDTLGQRAGPLSGLITRHLHNGYAEEAAAWINLAAGLPQDMSLAEVLELLSATTEADQAKVVRAVQERLHIDVDNQPAGRRIRILTMHGAKGLSGKIVFIPSIEQGVMPSFRAINATGLLIEARRLFFVSLTRAMAACVISHAVLRTGPSALRLAQRPQLRLARSMFLNEMGVLSQRRNAGLDDEEATTIVRAVNDL